MKRPAHSRAARPLWPVTSEWKRDVQIAMAARGINRVTMARRVDCHASTLSALWHPATMASRLVGAIHAELGWEPPEGPVAPGTVVECGLLREVMDSWSRLSRDQRKEVLRLVDTYAPPRRPEGTLL